MANKARKYSYAESLAPSTSTLNTDTTKVTLNFAPDANSDYVYIWNADVAMSVITDDIVVTLKNNSATALSITNWEAKDITDYNTISGIAKESFGASPTSQSITLTWRNETSGRTASIKNARIIAIKLTSADAFVENTADSSTTSASLQTATTLTFTPATSGNYLIIGSCESRSASTTVSVNTQITYNSVAYSAAASRPNDTTNYSSSLLQASVGTLTATSQSVTFQYSSGTAGTAVNCRRARLLALRLDEFTTSSITTDNAATTTTSITYETKTTTGAVSTTNGLQYLVIGTASCGPVTGTSGTISVGYGLSVGGTYVAERFVESISNGLYAPGNFGAFTVITASSDTLTTNFDYYVEQVTLTNPADEVTLSVLLLEATDLYWVGGTGTWDASSNTNWAITSGGTGSAGIPKLGTNVYFDSASDLGGIFTVTISTGATCKDLTVSGLDQTMTLSGSAAMSVYGNFSVPATNFTQSYTGTITFAATASKTITTNGKSFTAFTFDGVSGTWTLQDNLTLTGAATLTNGTFALGSYTFTCDNFASNNSNTRTINFDTGKIVVSSASTATVWNTSTVTNLTVSGTPLVELTGGGATTKTVTLGALSESNSISVTLNTTAGTVALTGSARNLILANNSFTLSNAARTIYGDFTINGTSPTLTAGTGTTTFGATSGTKTITTNGKTLDFPITFNGAGGTFSLADDLTIGTSTSRAVVLTNGTLELNGKNLNIYGTFALSQGLYSPDRQLLNTPGGTNKIVLSIVASSSTQVWNSNDLRSYYTDGKVNVQITGTGLYYPGRTTDGITYLDTLLNWQVSSTTGDIYFGDATWGGSFRNLTIDNNVINVFMYGAVYTGNLLIAGTNPTISNSAASYTWTWFGSSTKTINMNGNNSNRLDYSATINSTSGTVQLLHNLDIGANPTARTLTLTAGTLDLNEYNLTLYGGVTTTNANTRTIDFGSASKFILSGGTGTVWNSGTATNFSVLGNNPLLQLTGDANSGSNFTFTFGTHSEAGSLNVQLSSVTGPTSVAITGTLRDLTIDNYDITLSNGTRSLYGNLLISGSTPTLSAGNSITTFGATSGIKTITTNGKTLDFPITFNGTGGTWSLIDDLAVGTTTSRTVTLTAGILDINSKNLTIFGVFSSSGTGTRKIQNTGGTGKIILSLNTTTTVWSTATVTNMTTDGNVIVRLSGGGVGTKTISAGALSEADAINFEIACTAGIVAFTANNTVENLTLENTAYTLSNIAITIYGNLTQTGVSATLTGGANTWTFAATSGTKTISATQTLDFPLTFNGAGGTWQLQNALTIGSTRLATLTAGILNLNNNNFVAAGGFAVTGTETKVLAHGTGNLVISLAGATAFNATGSNLTSTGTGSISMTAATAKTFVGGGNSYNALSQDGLGNLTITGSNTFKNLTNTVQPVTVTITSGTTQTFTEGFSLNGILGSIVTLNTTTTSAATLTKSSGLITVKYINISYSTATGGATWKACTDEGAVDGGNNSGWLFQSCAGSSNMLMMFL